MAFANAGVGQVEWRREASLPSTTALTLMRWVLVDSVANYYNLFQLGQTDGSNFLWVGTEVDGVTPAVELWNDPTDIWEVSPTVTIDSAQWFHFALVKNASTYTLYVSSADGTRDLEVAVTFTSSALQAPERLTVWLDEATEGAAVKVFEQALSASELRRERDHVGTFETVWGTYPMDTLFHVQPQALYDLSGSARHLTAGVVAVSLTDGPPILRYGVGTTERTSGTVVTGTTGSLAPAVPSASTVGDLLLLYIAHKGAGYATVPAGWTLVGQETSGATKGEVYWKRHSFVGAAYAAEGATVALADLGAVQAAGLVGIAGILHDGDPVVAVTTRANASGASGTAKIEDLTAGLYVVTVGAMGNNTDITSISGAVDFTDRPGQDGDLAGSMNNILESGHASGIRLIVGTAIKRSVGDIPAFVFTPTPSAENVGITFALALEASAGATLLHASKFYYGGRRFPFASMRGVLDGVWTHEGFGPNASGIEHHDVLLWPLKDMVGEAVTVTYTNNESPLIDVLLNRLILPLQAQTVPSFTATLTGYTRAIYETDSAVFPSESADVQWRARVYLSNGRTCARKTLLQDGVLSGVNFTNTGTWRTFTIPVTGFTCADDDCLIIELGYRIIEQPQPPVDYPEPSAFVTVTQRVGGQRANASATLNAAAGNEDGVEGTTTTAGVPFLSLSMPLLVQDIEGTPPPNDSFADAIVFNGDGTPQSDSQDSSGSLDVQRGCWYGYTPALTGRYIIHTLGSIVPVRVRVWTGSPGSLLEETAAQGLTAAGIAGSRSVYVFDFVAETPYYFQVTSDPSEAAHPPSCGGEFMIEVCPWRDVEPDDIFYPVAGTIYVYRETQLVKVQPAFSGLAFSGVAIDYTGRSMASIDGPTHTSERLVGAVFSGIIEILDLETLNIGESEIDFIFSIFGPDSSGPSTLEINEAGEMFVGRFGAFGLVAGSENSYENGPGPVAANHSIIQVDPTTGDFGVNPVPSPTVFANDFDQGGSNYVRLDADGNLLYTSSGQYIAAGGTRVLKFNPSGASQESDFGSYGAGTGANPGGKGICVLPDGGILLCNGSRVERYNSSGALTQTYLPEPQTHAQTLADVDLTNDFEHFIVMDSETASLFKFVLGSGEQLYHNWTHAGTGSSTSFVVYRPDRFTPPHVCECCVATKLQVINLALLRIGVTKLVQSLDEASVEATVGNYIFEFEMKALLRAFPWPFATKYADAADEVDGYMSLVTGSESDPVNDDWTYAYAYPPDCLFARRLVTRGTGREFDPEPQKFRVGRLYNVESDPDDDQIVVFSNEEDPVLEYTAFIECAEDFADQLFISALAWRLAAIMGPSLSRVPDIEKRAIVMFERSLSTAAAVAAKEHQPVRDGEAEHIRVRE